MRKYFWLTHELKNCGVSYFRIGNPIVLKESHAALALRAAALLLSVLMPMMASAALDDVTLTTDADISVAGFTLDISGSSAIVESIEVGANNFIVVLRTGSSIEVSSSARADFSVSSSGGTVKQVIVCGSSTSTLTLSESDDNVTVTVTPNSTCDAGGTSAGPSGGGGGIVTPSQPVATTTAATPATPAEQTESPAVPAVPSEAAQPSPTAQLVSPVFNRALGIGMSHDDVKRLQELLNTDPDTRLAESGVGSLGNETDYFGPLTENAVKKFQAKHGIVSSGTPATTGYGLVGPLTRAKLAEVFAGAVPTVPIVPTVPAEEVAQPATVAVGISSVFDNDLFQGISHPDVRRLQVLLNTDPDTRLAEEGVGSPGNETNYFGPLTQAAVQNFQAKHGIVSSGSPATTGYGRVGPQTRAALAEMFESD